MKLKIILSSLSILFLLMLSGGIFYWYEWRPNVIRQSCVIEAMKADNLTPNDRKTLEAMIPNSKNNLDDDQIKVKDNAYRVCLTKNGLKPESLYY